MATKCWDYLVENKANVYFEGTTVAQFADEITKFGHCLKEAYVRDIMFMDVSESFIQY